jgi:CheY-like chemotaxis protein
VEDVILNQLLIKTILDDFGFERDIASNGKIAIEKLQSKNYDIILMDLHMPEMNGFETTDYIRNKMNSAIPIIALTADVTTVDSEKCKAAGMNDYIAKPIDERLLYSKIIGLVKKPLPTEPKGSKPIKNNNTKKTIYIDLEYLRQRTKSDTGLMKEMILLYLEQTPPLVRSMKQSMKENDWHLLYATVHKMIPSFSIMGIQKEYEKIANRIQEYARQKDEGGQGNSRQQPEIKEMTKLVLQLETACMQACLELEKEMITIKNKNHE